MSDYQNPKPVANLGDANFLEYGGRLVYFDEQESTDPWMEVIEEPLGEDYDRRWTVYRFDLERLKIIREDGWDYLVPENWDYSWPYHAIRYDAWFHRNMLDIAWCSGAIASELKDAFCSEDVLQRAWAWCAIGDYYGFEELDSYPLLLGVHEAFSRYGLQDECECEACQG